MMERYGWRDGAVGDVWLDDYPDFFREAARLRELRMPSSVIERVLQEGLLVPNDLSRIPYNNRNTLEGDQLLFRLAFESSCELADRPAPATERLWSEVLEEFSRTLIQAGFESTRPRAFARRRDDLPWVEIVMLERNGAWRRGDLRYFVIEWGLVIPAVSGCAHQRPTAHGATCCVLYGNTGMLLHSPRRLDHWKRMAGLLVGGPRSLTEGEAIPVGRHEFVAYLNDVQRQLRKLADWSFVDERVFGDFELWQYFCTTVSLRDPKARRTALRHLWEASQSDR